MNDPMAHDSLRDARVFSTWMVAAMALFAVVCVLAWTAVHAAWPTAIVTTRGYADVAAAAIRVQVFGYTGGVFRFTVDGDGIFRAGFEGAGK